MDSRSRSGHTICGGKFVADLIQSIHAFLATVRVVNENAFFETRASDQVFCIRDESRSWHGGEGRIDICLVLSGPFGSEPAAVSTADLFNCLVSAADGFRILC